MCGGARGDPSALTAVGGGSRTAGGARQPRRLQQDRPGCERRRGVLLVAGRRLTRRGPPLPAARLVSEPFFDRRGHWHEGAAAQRTELACALRLSDPAWEARGLRGLARAEGRLGQHDSSLVRLRRALELFTELGDTTGQAHTHRSLGWVCEQQGDLPGALRHNERALELFRQSGPRVAQASVLNSVGWYQALMGRYRQALSHCFEALAMLQDLGDRYGQAGHLGQHRLRPARTGPPPTGPARLPQRADAVTGVGRPVHGGLHPRPHRRHPPRHGCP
ncbi:tetratricopeptide repeat protein [Streptomyces sp. NPDC102405]|uniref:tetratricopeptide repeat protein n=1 Tax=Streptomyces sp. NPDC102405 TaxID=3366170 RepID=UPI0038281E62